MVEEKTVQRTVYALEALLNCEMTVGEWAALWADFLEKARTKLRRKVVIGQFVCPYSLR